MTTYAQQIAAAAIEAAADYAEGFVDGESIADRIRALDLDAIIASVPVPSGDDRARFEAWRDANEHLLDTYNEPRECMYQAWQAAKRDALTQARELTDEQICSFAERFAGNGFPNQTSAVLSGTEIVDFARALLSASKGEK